MKTLFLLRHAESPMNAPTDRERTLSDAGAAYSKTLGDKLRHMNRLPDFIYCSPARRTQETLKNLELQVHGEQPERLYNAPAGDLLHFIQSTKDSVNALMVIAHNPGIHALAMMLMDNSDQLKTSSLHYGYPPGSLTILDCPCESWRDIQPGENRLIELIMP